MNAAGYVRVSSASQSHDMQRRAIVRAAKTRGDRIVSWYADTWTGASAKRPELDALRSDVRAGLVRRLYVYRLDRLSRGGIRDMLNVVDELRGGGCELVTLADGFDLGGPASDVVLAVLAWAAQAERLAIRERISAARRAKEASGQAWGRPPRLSKHEQARVRELSAQGRTVRAIAVALKVPKSIVGRVLSRKPTPVEARPMLAKAKG
jgi:DNA invertase Pin-like site-specific DNA recombinase